MADVKWIAKCLKDLAALGVLNTEKQSSDEYLKNKLVEKNANVSDNVRSFNVFLYPSATNCDKKSKDLRNCDLFTFANENKYIFREFQYTPATKNQPSSQQILTVNTVQDFKEGHYSCSFCYYKHRVLSLLERLQYAPLEIELPMAGANGTQTFFFVGLEMKKSKDDPTKYKVFMGFKYDYKDPKDSRAAVRKRYVLVSASLDSKVTYVELMPRENSEYDVDMKHVITSLPVDDLEVELFDLNSIYYTDENMNEINLGAERFDSFVQSFAVSVDVEGLFETVRPVVSKKLDECAKQAKKLEEQVGMIISQQTVEKKAAEIGIGDKGKENKEEQGQSLFFFSNKKVFASIAVATIVILFFYYALGRSSEQADRKERVALL
ncbi:uncharacterized protein VICG_01602 [Vittaforma corneae ATCC 50505]|uniref:Uncharacterized protein n=1 Tax=Vittaforma corneae (strain ATCC 50505) TaxID=993615 RepID=L2GKI0_VITCO|nr:uncharacterized protein VICG_01602 [Vittaforma corneae ATCC 50505]ELA41361.1 hypothetical protein VICG_01602 [Vittaforma corneae ATCC 50505]